MYNDEFNNLNNQYHYTKKDHLPQDDYQTNSTNNYQPEQNYQQTPNYQQNQQAQNAYSYQQTYTNPQPQQSYAPYTGSNYQAPHGNRKNRMWMKITAAILGCAIIGGACGFGGAALYKTTQTETTTIQQSARIPTTVTVKKVDGKTEMKPAEVYASTVNSVVSINCSSTSQNIWGQKTESPSSGSGFIITEDGYIVTNYHVIDGVSSIKVTLHDGTTYDAKLIGGEKDYDVAVIKVDAQNLPAVVMGDSTGVNVGDPILAIGNPLGELTFSMSQGIVSCTDRAINVDGTPFNMIQIDCSVNPGNSGGPLMNTYGEVIGIVSAKYSNYSTTTVEGLGFAIPINDVNAIITDIIENGSVTNKAYLGITAGSMSESMAAQYNISITTGVFVYSVEDGSAAKRAGLKLGDVITKLNDADIKNMNDLSAAKKGFRAGDTVTLTVFREGQYIETQLTFDSQPLVTEPSETPNANNGNNGNNNGGMTDDEMREFYNWFNQYRNFFGR